MLAELVRVPVRAVRHWHRKGHLDAERCVGRLPYFDFEQVRVAQRLAELLAAGCSLSQIDRKLDELARLRPDAPRPLADASVVVVGRRLYVRRGDQLTEPSGQLLIDFDAAAMRRRRRTRRRGRGDDSHFGRQPRPARRRSRIVRQPTISARSPTISSKAARPTGRSRSIARS